MRSSLETGYRQRIPLPIERETYLNSLIRIACKIIILRYRANPLYWADHQWPKIIDVATELRPMFPNLYWPLVYIAKNIANGHSLNSIYLSEAPYDVRALHKRRLPLP